MLPRKLATILLLAFSLFELVVALSQRLCSERNKKNGEVGEYSVTRLLNYSSIWIHSTINQLCKNCLLLRFYRCLVSHKTSHSEQFLLVLQHINFSSHINYTLLKSKFLNICVFIRILCPEHACHQHTAFFHNFYVLLTVYLGIILVNNQLDAQFLVSCMFISVLYMFRATTCPSSWELIVRIRHLVYVTLCRWPSGVQVQNCTPNRHLYQCFSTFVETAAR